MQGSILQGRKIEAGSPAGRLSRFVKSLRPWVASDGNADAVTYSVVASPAGDEGADRRSDPRRRVRLQSGKVVDLKQNFIVECLIRERSAEGARLVLARPAKAPDRIGLFDDAARSIKTADIVWRHGSELGIRFTPKLDTPVKDTTLASLSGKFYAVGA